MSEALCVALLVSGQPQAFVGDTHSMTDAHAVTFKRDATHRTLQNCPMSSVIELVTAVFVTDLFSLTHGSLASTSIGPASPTPVPQAASLSEETAALLSQELVAAHQAYRTGDHEASYESYQQLAEHSIAHQQLPNAKFFYERCLQVSKEHAWTEGQAAAHTNLGVYQFLLEDHCSSST